MMNGRVVNVIHHSSLCIHHFLRHGTPAGRAARAPGHRLPCPPWIASSCQTLRAVRAVKIFDIHSIEIIDVVGLPGTSKVPVASSLCFVVWQVSCLCRQTVPFPLSI